ARAAARRVRELPRGPHVSAAEAGARAGGPGERGGGRGADRRAPRVLRAGRLRADGRLRAREAPDRRTRRWPGNRRASGYAHRRPAALRGPGRSLRQPSHQERGRFMSTTAIDPILLEVLRNRLDAIADEMELTLLKSAASPIVKEGLDAS